MKREELELLGVSKRFTDEEPTVYSFPLHFNPDGVGVWAEILESPEFDAAEDKWKFALREYLARMRARGTDPFRRHGPTRIDNNWIAEFLRLQRKRVVQYFNHIGILRGLECWSMKTRHDIELVQSGFWIHSRLFLKETDPRTIINVLRRHHFYPDRTKERRSDLGYVHWYRWHVGQIGRIKFGYAASGRQGGIISFSVYVPRLPMVTLDDAALRNTRRSAFEEFVLRFIWMPIVFAFPFKGISWHCKF